MSILNNFIFKTACVKRIKSISVDRSQINDHGIDILLNFKGIDDSVGLSMDIEDALNFRDELNKSISQVLDEKAAHIMPKEVWEEFINETLLQNNDSDA